MDGYAVATRDIAVATRTAPAILPAGGEIAAGDIRNPRLACLRTGAQVNQASR